MEGNDQIKILQAAIGQKISQLARKYSVELVSKVWEEIKTTEGDLAIFSVSGWKGEMTLTEALECLDDYCDFIESMVRKTQEKEGQIHYIPALFN